MDDQNDRIEITPPDEYGMQWAIDQYGIRRQVTPDDIEDMLAAGQSIVFLMPKRARRVRDNMRYMLLSNYAGTLHRHEGMTTTTVEDILGET